MKILKNKVTSRQNKKYLNSKKTKQYFIEIGDIIAENICPNKRIKICDLGCAAGAFNYYLNERFGERCIYSGIDIDVDLINKAKKVFPDNEFFEGSILKLPDKLYKQYDIFVSSGVLGFFDIDDLKCGFEQMSKILKPHGMGIIFNAFNKYGIDMIENHRIKNDGGEENWETGLNCFCFETIKDIASKYFSELKFRPFNLKMPIKKSKNPMYAWTINTEENPYQLVVGCNLLRDFYFLILKK